MHENEPTKLPKYAPIKFPHTYLLLVLEQNRKTKQNETKQTKDNLKPSNVASGISNAHDMSKIIIPTDFGYLYT